VKRTIAALALAGVLVVSGCGYRNVDVAQTGAEPIPGAGALHVFCDRFGTLVYFTRYDGSEDDYEAFFAQACVPGTRPIVSTAAVPVNPTAVQSGPPRWAPDGDLGNTQPGTEKDGG
jgi:hypothetical protein